VHASPVCTRTVLVVEAVPGNPPGLKKIHFDSFEPNYSDRREEEFREKIAFQKSISEVLEVRTQSCKDLSVRIKLVGGTNATYYSNAVAAHQHISNQQSAGNQLEQ
jgi:hypothetical protein